MVVGKILSKMDKRMREQGSRFQIRPYEMEAEWVRDHFDLAVDNYAMALRNETYEFGEMATAYVMESKRRKIDYPAHLAPCLRAGVCQCRRATHDFQDDRGHL